MTIKVLHQLDGGLLDEAWTLYHDAFHDLAAFAIQRHLMYRHEFDEVMADVRVQKYLYLDNDGVLCGLSTYTNQLDAVPLISPPYFQRRWPQHYAERRIWYVGFVAVRPHAPHAFVELVEAMQLVAATQDGVVGLDMCRYNDEARRMSRAVDLLVHRITNTVQVERADEQSYWLYEFPPTP